MIQLDVHNARDRVSAVSGRSTVLQDFQMLSMAALRDSEQVNERERAAGSYWVGRHTLAID